MIDKVLIVKQVAEHLKFGEGMVYKKVQRGELPGRRGSFLGSSTAPKR